MALRMKNNTCESEMPSIFNSSKLSRIPVCSVGRFPAPKGGSFPEIPTNQGNKDSLGLEKCLPLGSIPSPLTVFFLKQQQVTIEKLT